MTVIKLIKVEVGDMVKLRKTHPCGSDTWQVTRIGADIGLCCQGCRHRVLLARDKFRQSVKVIIGKEGQ